MSVVKSFSVGNGDMFYIEHNSDNFTIIDCCVDIYDKAIIKEVKELGTKKGITRFISTHPDEDHLAGLTYLDQEINILNFYVVKNKATKDDESDDFKKYCELRDSEKAFYIYKGCSRKWMNQSSEEEGGRKTSGIEILWPDTSNKYFKEALLDVEAGLSPNNISAIIKYSIQDGACILWLGDLETDFMENILPDVNLPKVDILFAAHHGRDSGTIPASWLKKLSPKIIIIGEAPSKYLNYYDDYNTITQNSVADIVFDCYEHKVDVYVYEKDYSVSFLDDEGKPNLFGGYYLGTLNL